MESKEPKWAIGLLVGLLMVQLAAWNRQTRLSQELAQLQSRAESHNNMLLQAVQGVGRQVRERDEFPDWLTKPEVSLTPGAACGEGMARVTFSLKDWTSGTKATLQYRPGTGQPWVDAENQDQGNQSYAATFPVPVASDWRVHIMKEGGPSQATTPRSVYLPPESQQYRSPGTATPAYQYRIMAEMPGGSRATAALPIPLTRDLVTSAHLTIRIGPSGDYTLSAEVDPKPPNRCVQIESIVARPVGGEKALGEYALAGQPLSAQWRSEATVTRIDLVVRHGGHESVIPVAMPGE